MVEGPVLSVENLDVVIKRKSDVLPIVRQASFHIQPGSIFGLVGESGCGKTMTCLSILNLLPAGIERVGGSIQLAGTCLDNLPVGNWQKLRGGRIALIMQNPMSSFDPIRTIGDHFMETICAHNRIGIHRAREIAVDYLEKVGLPDAVLILRQYPFQLSGGMLQRVMIAIALAQKPDIIIADEPTTALDATAQIQILDLLADVRTCFGTSILLISHDLGVIARLADSVAVMYGGQIVEQGPVASVFAKPLHPYTVSLLQVRNGIGLTKRKRLSLVAKVARDADCLSDGCSFAGRCASATRRCKSNIPSPAEADTAGNGHWVRCLKHGNTGLEAIKCPRENHSLN